MFKEGKWSQHYRSAVRRIRKRIINKPDRRAILFQRIIFGTCSVCAYYIFLPPSSIGRFWRACFSLGNTPVNIQVFQLLYSCTSRLIGKTFYPFCSWLHWQKSFLFGKTRNDWRDLIVLFWLNNNPLSNEMRSNMSLIRRRWVLSSKSSCLGLTFLDWISWNCIGRKAGMVFKARSFWTKASHRIKAFFSGDRREREIELHALGEKEEMSFKSDWVFGIYNICAYKEVFFPLANSLWLASPFFYYPRLLTKARCWRRRRRRKVEGEEKKSYRGEEKKKEFTKRNEENEHLADSVILRNIKERKKKKQKKREKKGGGKCFFSWPYRAAEKNSLQETQGQRGRRSKRRKTTILTPNRFIWMEKRGREKK